MLKYDIGVEGKFRVNGVEAASGELARDEFLRRFNEFLGAESKLTVERIWFQPSAQSNKQG
jgi:hypothetical protein